MSVIEGTATISLETLDCLRENEDLLKSVRFTASKLIERIDSEQYEKKCKEINEMSFVSGSDIKRLYKEAEGTLQIVVSTRPLRRLIRDFMDSEKSNTHYEISEMTEEEFAKIRLVLESRQCPERAGWQQDTSVCEMCEAYMADTECDIKEDCPAAGIVKRLKDAEETIREKEKIIKKRDKEIREFKKKLDDSELKRSYMVDPMAIGDRHEMGG